MQGNAGTVRTLDQRKVQEAIEASRMSYSHLIGLAERTFEECVRLAQTSLPGAVQAREALAAAEQHGLADCAYRVRGDMVYGWGGVAGCFRVEPLRGVALGGDTSG